MVDAIENYARGVDISVVQGNLNFVALKDAGYQFVICRAGVGNDAPDTHCLDNLEKAEQAGLKTGVYHFIYPLPPVAGKTGHDPVEQANLHYGFIGDRTKLVVCDAEWPVIQDWRKWNVDAAFISEWLKSYLEEYERLSGIKMVVYSYPSFIQALKLDDSFTDYPYWTASYTTTPVVPAPWSDWVIWQNSGGTATFQGVKIDTDFCKDLSIFG